MTAIYGSDFSVTGYRDREFDTDLSWDTDLLSGYTPIFLSRIEQGGAKNDQEVSIDGLAARLREVKPQTILSVGYSPRFHRQAMFCARRMRRPILFRAETTDHARNRGNLKKWFRDRALTWLYGQCAALLPVGKKSHEHYQRLGVPEEKLFFSPYCVDTNPFSTSEEARARLRPATRAELGLSEEKFIIGFCGKLSPRKAPQMLIETVRLLPNKIQKDCAVLLVGEGELKPALAHNAATSPSVALRHVGFQNQRTLSRYYHAMDLLVLPSLHSETWGLVVNEALHHGVPAIVSEAVGCAPDLIESGRTGDVFTTGSPRALAEALIRISTLVGNPAVRARCRSQAENYSVAKAAEGIAAAYHSVIHGRHG